MTEIFKGKMSFMLCILMNNLIFGCFFVLGSICTYRQFESLEAVV